MRLGGRLIVGICLVVGEHPGPILPPPEPEAVVFDGTTADALTIDVDGDGTREVVRVVAGPDGSGPLRLEALVDDGGWRLDGGRDIDWPPGDEAEGPTDASVRLVRTRLDTEERAVAVLAAPRSADCCGVIVELGAARPGTVRLGAAATEVPPVNAALAADLDGDGVDELVLRTSSSITTELSLLVYAREGIGGRFIPAARIGVPDRFVEPPFVLAETDGLPGDEIGLLDRVADGRLARVGWSPERGATVETTGLFSPRLPRQEVTAVRTMADARLLVVHESSAYSARWPAGSGLERRDAVSVGGQLLGRIGGAGEEVYVVRHASTGHLAAFDDELRVVPGLEDLPADKVRWPLTYAGPLVSADGDQAILANGTLIVGVAGGLHARPVAELSAIRPLQAAGQGGQWVPLVRGLDARHRSPDGGALRGVDSWRDGRLSIARATEALARGACPVPGGAWVRFEGAGPTVARPTGPVALAAAKAGYAAVVADLPAGSAAYVRSEAGTAAHLDLVAPLRVTLPTTLDDRVEVAVVTPGGRSCAHDWTVREVVADQPVLSLSSRSVFLAGAAVVHGTAEPGAIATVAGIAVSVGADGSFAVEVPASLLPADVSVRIVDRLGRERSSTVAVNGYLDWASAAWVPAALVLVLVAGLMVARRPRVGPAADLEELSDEARAALDEVV